MDIDKLELVITNVKSQLDKDGEPGNARLMAISELFQYFVEDPEADLELMEAAAPLMKLIKDRGFDQV